MSAINPDSVLAALANHIGASQGVCADDLVAEIGAEPDGVSRRRLRQVVTGLRMLGHHVCAHPRNGYYMARTDDELDATCEFLMERAMSSLTQISRMRNVSMPDLRGQMKLPT